jgi:hypothetical protein
MRASLLWVWAKSSALVLKRSDNLSVEGSYLRRRSEGRMRN